VLFESRLGWRRFLTSLAVPFPSVEFGFVLVPLCAVFEQMVRSWAAVECTDIRPKVSEYVSPIEANSELVRVRANA